MEQIFEKMLAQTIKNLETLHKRKILEYKVIAGNETWGALEVAKKPKKSKSKFPFGTIRNYVLPFINELQPDSVVSIPLNEFGIEHLRGNVCAWCTAKWGKNTYATTFNRKTKAIEVYRYSV